VNNQCYQQAMAADKRHWLLAEFAAAAFPVP